MFSVYHCHSVEHLYSTHLFDPRSFSFSLQINRNCGYKWWECYLTWIRPCSPCCKGICIFCFALLILLCHTYIIHTAIYCTALQTMSCESITSVNLRLSFSLLWNLITLFLLFECIQSMIELSRTQDEEVGDGTTSVIILGMFLHDLIAKFLILLYYIPNGRSDLSWFIGQHILFLQFSIFCIFGAAGEMLHVADAFIDKIHPTVICRGNLIVLTVNQYFSPTWYKIVYINECYNFVICSI